MAKGQNRGNREAKKPKQDKPKAAAAPQTVKGVTSPAAGARKER